MATIKEIDAKSRREYNNSFQTSYIGKQKKYTPANIQKIENLIREMGYVQKMGLRVLNKKNPS